MDENFKLNNTQIFGTEFTKNIDPKYISRFKNIILCINNYNNFQQMVKVQNIVTMDMNLSTTDLSTRQIATILSNKSAITDCGMFIGDPPEYCNMASNEGVVTVADVITIPITLDDNNNTSNRIVDNVYNNINVKDSLLSTVTSSDNTARDNHKEFMKNICKEIYKEHYKQLLVHRENYIFEGGMTAPDINDDVIVTVIDEYTKEIDKVSIDVDSFNESNSISYYRSICEAIARYSKAKNNHCSNPIVYNLFLTCFYPYIWFIYISGQVALIDSGKANDKAPRIFILRRLAVMFAYVFEFYTILTIYNHCSIALKSKGENMLDSINTCMKQEMMLNSQVTYETLHSDNITNVQSSKDLDNMNKDIVLTQNNLNKAIINNKEIYSKYKNSYVFLWLWVALLIILNIIFVLALVFLNNKGSMQYVYFTSIVVAVAIFITLIVDMLN